MTVLVLIAAAISVPIITATRGGFDGLIPRPAMSFTQAQPLVLPGEPNEPVAFITVSSRYDAGAGGLVYSLVRSDGVSPGPVWSTDLPGQASGDRPIRTDGRSAILAVDRTVLAVSLATGAIVWQTTLTDVVPFTNCAGCFEIFGSHLVATSSDANVQAIDTVTGTATWSRRLDGTTTRAFVSGPHYVVMDGTGGDYRLITIDPATGGELMSFVPTCQADAGRSWSTDLSSSSELLASNQPGRLWFLDGSSPTCIQQYDVTTGAMVSQAFADTASITGSSRMLETPLGLVITSFGVLGIVDPSGATFRLVSNDPDADLVAFGATDTAVLVQATNKRGTATSSVRAIDPNTGATFWDAPMGEAVPVDTEGSTPGRFRASSPGRGGVFSAHLDGSQVQVLTMVEFDDNTQQVVLDSFDAVTGAATSSVTYAPESDDIIPELGPGIWSGSRVITSVGDDRIDVVDFTTMSLAHRLS